MKMYVSKKSLVATLALFLTATAAWALPPRINWEPNRFAPVSVAPGERAAFPVTLVHTGMLPIPATGHLRVIAEGEIAPFVSIAQPAFPSVLKRGDRVTVIVTVTAPQDMPLSLKRGDILLERALPNDKVKEIFRAEPLPTELTFSTIPMPPDPGNKGEVGLLGIDSDGNGVRDDIDRFIVFAYPDSEKRREALKQTARSLHAYLRDNEDKAKTRENSSTLGDNSLDCLVNVFDGDLNAAFAADDRLRVQFLDTKARSRAYAQADQKMGGYVSNNGTSSEWDAQRRAACSFDADSLPN